MPVPPANIKIVNHLPEIRRVADLADEFCARHAVPQGFAQETQVILDELLSNVIHHAYTDTAEHEIRVALDLAGDDLIIKIEDDGKPFDPTHAGAAELTAARSKTAGGLGLMFVRALCDRISYQRAAGRNCLSVTKHVHGAGPVVARPSSLDLSDARHGELSVLSVAGRLDTANALALKTRLENLIVAGARFLAVDLSGVSYASSAGFWALLFAENLAKRAGGGMVLCGLNHDLAHLVERGGLAQVLGIAATQKDALHALRGLPGCPAQ